LFWCTGVIKEVVLDLEVFSEWKEDVKGKFVWVGGGGTERVAGRNVTHVHGKSDWKVERIIRGLVDDDQAMSGKIR
jgi:hypothetical protein